MTEAYKILNEINMNPDLVRDITGYLGPDPHWVEYTRKCVLTELSLKLRLDGMMKRCKEMTMPYGKYRGETLAVVLNDRLYAEELMKTDTDDVYMAEVLDLLGWYIYYEFELEEFREITS